VPSSARSEPSSTNASASSAWPRWRGRTTPVHQGRQEAGQTASRRARLGVSQGTRAIPSLVATWPSARALSKASSDGDVRENLANAAMSAAVQDIAVAPPR